MYGRQQLGPWQARSKEPSKARPTLRNSINRAGKASRDTGSEAPAEIAGLGPCCLKKYVPGQRIVLKRNPYYWKVDARGTRLPYLDEIAFLFVPSEDAQVIRFQAGDTDVLTRFSAQDFSVLERAANSKGYRVHDLGPGLEYNFLFFNLNDLSALGFATNRAKAKMVSGPPLSRGCVRSHRSREHRPHCLRRSCYAALEPSYSRKQIVGGYGASTSCPFPDECTGAAEGCGFLLESRWPPGGFAASAR